MANKKWDYKEVHAIIENSGEELRHERVAILADTADDTFGDSGLYRPEAYKGEALMGTVVFIGSGEAVQRDFRVGSRVQYNKYNVIKFQFDIEGEGEFEVVTLHDKDIYWVNHKTNNVG